MSYEFMRIKFSGQEYDDGGDGGGEEEEYLQ